MPDTPLESDPLFQLLTDALRAGPGSAEWSQAVSRLREAGTGGGGDEYQLLLRAREGLEGGREYKAVRAGAGFTRQLFGKIDEEQTAAKGKGASTASVLAYGAGLVILGVVIAVVVLLSRGGRPEGGAETLPALFPTTLVSSTFARDDKGLVVTGDAAGGLHPGAQAVVEPPIAGRFEVEADVQAPPGGAETAVVDVVIVPAGEGAGRASEANWPRWQLYGANQRVIVGDATKTIAPVPADGKLTVRVVVGTSAAAVYANKQLLWTGPHGLPDGPKAPRVGILPAPAGARAVPTVSAVRVRGESKP